MMSTMTTGREFLKELEMEASATRKCLERVPADKLDYKPHEKSMALGYLALIVAEIPKWITSTVEDSEIDFATYEHVDPKSGSDLVLHFDENMRKVRNVLQNVSDESLDDLFFLKNKGETMFSSPKKESIMSSINHMVHHRGQLTVYLRMLDIAVPSIYGPSADENGF